MNRTNRDVPNISLNHAFEKRRTLILHTLIYFCFALLGFAAIAQFGQTKSTYIDSREHLNTFDFSSGIAYISEDCFDWYPGAFYAPGQFAQNAVPSFLPDKDNGKSGYYTYRLILKLEEGKVYGLSGNSATYAQTLWINGKVYSQVGVPGKSLDKMIPQMSYFAVYFEAGPGETEIIIHRSGFVHANGGRLFPLYLGEQSDITSMYSGIWVREAATMGCMFMAALVFFGIFLFSNNQRHYLLFALACLVIILRSLSSGHKLLTTMLPDFDWNIAMKLDYLASINFHTLLFMYINRMFERKLSRLVNIIGLCIIGAWSLLVLLTSSNIYTHFLPYMQFCVLFYVLATVVLLIRLVIKEKDKRILERYLILLGTVSYAVFLILEVGRYFFVFVYRDLNFLQTGMTIFVLANTLALALNFTRTENELADARRSELETQETNRMMERLGRVRENFLVNITHEIHTPLTVIASLAQLTQWQIRESTANEETDENLTDICEEAKRLSELAHRLLDISMENENDLSMESVELGPAIERAAQLAKPIAKKNNNSITADIAPSLPWVMANGFMLRQVLLNLITNANRHAAGAITIAAEPHGDAVLVSVTDDGDGIEPELFPHLFQRGMGSDGRTGLGLSICKEIVENHGGRIWAESEKGKGCAIRFTLPAWKEGEA